MNLAARVAAVAARCAVWLSVLASASCAGPGRAPAGLARSVSVTGVEAPDTTAYSKHWTLGSRSAWFDAAANVVLILDEKTGRGLRVGDLPTEYGRIVATGWSDGLDFFVHFQASTDTGTMVFVDVESSVITKVERWAAW